MFLRGLFRLKNGLIFGQRNYEKSTIYGKSSEITDFRSDTLTKPDSLMRSAIANSIVGDDVYQEDPTVNYLQNTCADLFKKEAALFVTSGTMGNLLSIMSHTRPGDEIIVGRTAHIHRWEQGNYARFAGVSAEVLDASEDGSIPIESVRRAIRSDDIHMPRSALICLENTNNFLGGKTLSLDYMNEVKSIARGHNIPLHIDGARFYNAAIALNMSVHELASPADSLMMCFSKGLGAPVGSIIVGTKDFIERCRRNRKAIGGGWRQAGILASAALHALSTAVDTITNDHLNAQYLCKNFNEKFRIINDFESVFASVATNMVIVNLIGKIDAFEFANKLEIEGILVMPFDKQRVRIVLHKGVGKNDIDLLISTCDKIFARR